MTAINNQAKLIEALIKNYHAKGGQISNHASDKEQILMEQASQIIDFITIGLAYKDNQERINSFLKYTEEIMEQVFGLDRDLIDEEDV